MDGRLMTCQHCDEEATVHLTETVGGRRRDLHLCAACAKEAGVALPDSPPSLALDSVIQSFIVSNVGELVGELAGMTCPDCGIKFMEFRARGRLGCPHDYRVFSGGLLPLLLRMHGATRHVGKVGRSRPAASRRLRLRTQLREAIAREDYELAVQLRDQLRHKDADA